MDLQIVGGGQMGAALAAGVVAAGVCNAANLCIVELDEPRRTQLQELIPGVVTAAQPGPADGTVIATKPPHVAVAVRDVVAHQGGTILSIAAGVTLTQLQDAAGADHAVLWAMPNTPALIGRGASCFTAGAPATAADIEWAQQLLASVGYVAQVPEHQLSAVTGVSGSGPAYVFLIAEAMIEGAVAQGLPRPLAQDLVAATIHGAGELLAAGNVSPSELRAQVTSPGGTTAQGLLALEQRSVRAALMEAIDAATRRANELS